MNRDDFILRWRNEYDFRTFIKSALSLLITVVFACYNGFLGISHSSFWHGSICVYYLLLVLIRGFIIMAEQKAYEQRERAEKIRSIGYLVCSGFLLVLNLCLIGPIAILVMQQKPVNMTMVPAIAMAAYAFYKIGAAAFNLVKRKKSANCLVRLLGSIFFIDAMVSLVTLQNTLIMISGSSYDRGLMTLSAYTSGLMWAITVVISVIGLVKRGKCRQTGKGEQRGS